MIHHYTSIPTLEAILRSGRLRFTRLDKFDDALEAQRVAGIDFGSQFFASCWIKNDAEDIAQWSMYGDRQCGVRISLTDDPFEWHRLDGFHQVPGTDAKWQFNNVDAPYTLAEVFGDGYLLIPEGDRSQFLKEVCYVDDVAEAYKQRIRDEGDSTVIYGYPGDLAKYKWDRWAFQREHRFVLTTRRGPARTNDPAEYGERYSELVRDPQWRGQGALSHYIDLKLSPLALQDAVFTVGPLSSEVQEGEVVRLRNKYAPKAHIRTSELKGKIRTRA